MSKKVNLEKLIREMESQFQEWTYYLHLESGSVVMIANDILFKAEDEEPIEELEEWEQTEYAVAQDILEHPTSYLELPDKEEFNEYRMMESFCYSLEDEHTRQRLLTAIQGQGAFRRFKDQLGAVGKRDEWFSFRKEGYRDFALEWCEENNVEYE
ncbi:hypothetical protein FGG79_02740 [Bacillus sp. BHET2]|uniref:UPF0158 family protein n=1 Tax=Bacillus sp. BHET2 TaxID=2583818 RepID=UPI00110E121D|nr:UPF0158 family protein [Bacillus sp. BHET2]TMU87073.1 hypothetical protein FGG79_02740 [Bacillus sp. BHET2]